MKKINTTEIIMDITNVSAIFKIKDWDESKYLYVDMSNGKTRKFKKTTNIEKCKTDFDRSCVYINKSKYAYEYIKRFDKIIASLKTQDRVPKKGYDYDVYVMMKETKLGKDVPVLLVEGDYGMILAPRITN